MHIIDKGDILMINAKSRLLFFMLLIGVYLLAFMLNFMPAIKHPDLNVSSIALFSSILYALLLLIYSISGDKKIRIFSLVGILSGVLIYLIDHFILNAIDFLQHLLYAIFTIPFFGGNRLFDIHYAQYSLFLSLFYGVVLGVSICFKKK